MIDAIIGWNKENIKEYVRYTIIEKNKGTKAGLTVYMLLMAIIAVCSLVVALVTGMMWLLIATVCAGLMAGIFIAVLYYAINRYSTDIYEINSGSTLNGIEITATAICVKKDDCAKGLLNWDSVTEVDFNKDSAYITTAEGFLIIIEKNNIKEGSIDELKKIVSEKLVKQDD